MSLTSYRAAPPRDFVVYPSGQDGKLGAETQACKGKSGPIPAPATPGLAPTRWIATLGEAEPMKTIVLLLILGLILGFPKLSRAQDDPRSAIATDNPHLHVRAGLPHLKRKLEAGQRCHVAFLGGSITQKTRGHTAMVSDWMRQTFPEATVSVTNAGLSSTCSTSGAFRLKSHILANGDIDLLIVEFAVNDDQDAGHSQRECIRGMEGIVRQVQRDHPRCGIIMVHFVNPEMRDKIARGETPISIEAHEAVAERHGITSVNVAAEVAESTEAKRYQWKDYGGTHPGAFGYRVASNMIITALKAGLARKGRDPDRKAPQLLDEGSYTHGRFLGIGKARFSDGWKIGPVDRKLLPLGGIRSQYSSYQLLRGDQPGSPVTLDFTGKTIGAFVLAGPDAGILESRIDGASATQHDLFHRFSAGLNYPRSVIFGTNLKPGPHTLELQLSDEKNPRSKGTSASILFFEVSE